VIRLRTFGSPSLERDADTLGGAARQRRVLGLLAFVAAGRERGVSRDSVLAVLWSESDPEKARQALTQGLYHARRAIEEDELFLAGADLRLNSDVFTTDVWEFEDALKRGEAERAVALYEGAFLEGFYVNDAPEFERWVASERARLVRLCADALEELAERAQQTSDVRSLVRWRRRRAALDPLNATAATELMKALAAAGDRAAALQHARVYEILLREELDVAPEAQVVELTERLRTEEANAVAPNVLNGISVPVDAVPSVETSAPNDSTLVAIRGLASTKDDVLAPTLWWRRRSVAVALGFAVVMTLVIVFARLTRSPSPVAVQKDLIAVAPFRVAGADPSLAFLGEGLVDLLTTKLTDAGTMRPVDAGSMIAAWHNAGVAVNGGASRDVALGVGRRLGAEHLLVGSVVGAPAHVVISASVLRVKDGSVSVQASVEGPTDSLTSMIDRLAARLVAQASGMSERLANNTTTSLRAMRAFLDGQAAYRRGAYRQALEHFRNALENDPTFAMSGLGLAQTADRVNALSDLSRGLTTAWQYRAELLERDRIYLEALAGPRYPAASGERERLVAWERVVTATPDRAEAWVGLGRQLFYKGRLLGIGDAAEQAVVSFERARELDDAFVSPLQFLVQLAASTGDTAALRTTGGAYAHLDSVGDMSGFVRWRSAIALGDSARLTSIRRVFSSMPAPSLRTIALSGLYNFIEGRDAERALAALRARTVRASNRFDLMLAEHALALNRGELRRAQRLIDALDSAQPLSALPERLRILDVLYAAGDSAVAARSVERIAPHLSAVRWNEPKQLRDVAPDTARDLEGLCVAGQWYARHGNRLSASRAAERLTMQRGGSAATCAVLIEGVLAVRSRAADADARLARLDSLLLGGPPGEVTEYANLVLARLYAERGHVRRALAAVRRRSYMDAWPPYLAEQVREEGRLAATTGDVNAATAAYRQYLALRTSPDSMMRAEVEAVRSELQKLTGAQDR
jgi:DNA-binding SARP family transcriptional activator/TolB-like protein